MSEVTNVLVAFSIMEDAAARLAEIDAWLDAHEPLPFRSVWENESCCGGSKRMEAPLYAAASNYFPLSAFLEFMRTLSWDDPENVQLVLRAPQEGGLEDPRGLTLRTKHELAELGQ
jgi:hypothetical protein